MVKNVVRVMNITFIIIILLTSHALALSSVFSTAENFIGDGRKNADQTMSTSNLVSGSEDIYNILLGAGVMIAVVTGAILGIQFMTAGVDQKVEVKKAILPFVVGCIVIFGAFGIWKLVINLVKNL